MNSIFFMMNKFSSIHVLQWLQYVNLNSSHFSYKLNELICYLFKNKYNVNIKYFLNVIKNNFKM